MELYDITKLKRNEKQSNLYDFFVSTFRRPRGYENLPTVEISEENYMRLDLVSRSVFGTDESTDLLCNLNEIDNPLNIMGGDTLQITSPEGIFIFRVDDIAFQDQAKNLVDNNKTTKIDPNRRNYVEQNYSTTPTMNSTPTDPVSTNSGLITIGSE